jgi:hypothetical protein
VKGRPEHDGDEAGRPERKSKGLLKEPFTTPDPDLLHAASDSATTGYICCSQIGAGFLGMPNYGNVASHWPLAMIGNEALMFLLRSD